MADWWTHEREQELKKLWAEGHSCSKIGGKMGNTRNAIIGKVHRLKLPERLQAAKEVRRPPKLAFPKPPRAQKAVVIEKTMLVGVPTEGSQLAVIKSDVFLPPIGTNRILLQDLTSSMCKWPLGDPGADDFTYCGAPPCSSKDVYCSEHRKVASQPLTKTRRSKDFEYFPAV